MANEVITNQSAVSAVKSRSVWSGNLEFLLIGTLAYVAIIGVMMASYRVFMVERIRRSEEYHTASAYVVNSLSVKQELLVPIDSIEFNDVHVNRQGDYGFSEIDFQLTLKEGLNERLKVGLVKIADFWLVSYAILSPDTPRELHLTATYDKIIALLESIDLGDWERAKALQSILKKEVTDPFLNDYLAARLQGGLGNRLYAAQLLSDLVETRNLARPAMRLALAQIRRDQDDRQSALDVLVQLETDMSANEDKSGKSADLFSRLPRDPFIATLDPQNVRAEARKLLSQTCYDLGRFADGLDWANKAIVQAEKVNSSVIRSGALYLKALNLYGLSRYEDAESVFDSVIGDLDNPNLLQKSWAYFFKGDIAARFNRPDDSLDYYEMSVSLVPTNSIARKGAITYLMGRATPGDLEIALGMALRGIDYGADVPMFKDLATQLYAKLGVSAKNR